MFDMMKRWCEVTTLVMLMIACGTWPTAALAGGQGEGGEQQPRVIEITAARFEFTPSEIEVSVGESVRLLIRSTDVEHGFGIPTLGIRVQIAPGGDPVAVDFVAVEPGGIGLPARSSAARGTAG